MNSSYSERITETEGTNYVKLVIYKHFCIIKPPASTKLKGGGILVSPSPSKFNNTSRFIDDLGTLNNDGILVKEKEKIYPVELVLNVENQDDNHATFLDIEVGVEGDQFKNKTYDKTYNKRENYKFEIVNYPDLSGYIPHGTAYGVYTSQVI